MYGPWEHTYWRRRIQEWYLRRSIRTWWCNAARKKKREVDKKVADASERTRITVTVAKDDEAAALRQQLLEAQRSLAAEKHARELLAQDMKRSFMRGVCALNMEAMQVWPDGTEYSSNVQCVDHKIKDVVCFTKLYAFP
jgi:hypothetical protein